jgi:hypothetical protein
MLSDRVVNEVGGINSGPRCAPCHQKEDFLRIGQYGYRSGKNQRVARIANKIDELRKARQEGANSDTIKELQDEVTKLQKELATFSKAAGEIVDKDYWNGVNRSISNIMQKRINPDAPLREIKKLRESGAYATAEEIFEFDTEN